MTKRSKRHGLSPIGLTLSALSMLSLAAGCSYEAKGSFSSPGSATMSGGLEFTAGGVDTGSDRPDFIFGTTRGAGAREFSYLIAVNQMDPDTKVYTASSDGSASMTGGDYASSHVFDLDGVSVRVEHTAKVDPVTGAVSDEKLMVQGNPVDLSKGRLILLGDGRTVGSWVQSLESLPSAPADLSELPEFAATTVANLAQSNGEIEAFLER